MEDLDTTRMPEEIPPGIMSYLMTLTEKDDLALQRQLGVTLQQIRDFREGRRTYPAWKLERLAAVLGIPCPVLSRLGRFVPAGLTGRFKVNQRVDHPFRGPAVIEELHGRTCDIRLSRSGLLMHDIPLLAFCHKEIGAALAVLLRTPEHDAPGSDMSVSPSPEETPSPGAEGDNALAATPVAEIAPRKKPDLPRRPRRRRAEGTGSTGTPGAAGIEARDTPAPNDAACAALAEDTPADQAASSGAEHFEPVQEAGESAAPPPAPGPVRPDRVPPEDVKRCVAECRAAGMTMTAIAAALDISPAMLHSHVTGRRRMTVERFSALEAKRDAARRASSTAAPVDPVPVEPAAPSAEPEAVPGSSLPDQGDPAPEPEIAALSQDGGAPTDEAIGEAPSAMEAAPVPPREDPVTEETGAGSGDGFPVPPSVSLPEPLPVPPDVPEEPNLAAIAARLERIETLLQRLADGPQPPPCRLGELLKRLGADAGP